MKNLRTLATFTVLFAATACAQIPDTPAGRQFKAWCAAQDSGDRDTIQKYLDQNMPRGRVEQEQSVHNQHGGFDVKKVEESGDTRLVLLAQERGPAKQFFRITFSVEAADPHAIAGIRILPAQPPADLAPAKMTAADIEAAQKGAPYRQFAAWLDAFNSGIATAWANSWRPISRP